VQNLDGQTRTLRFVGRDAGGWTFAGGPGNVYNIRITAAQNHASLNKPRSQTIECPLARGGSAGPGPTPQPRPQPGPQPVPQPGGGNTANAGAMLQAVNAYRRNAGAPPLALDSLLNGAALRHSRTMAASNTLSHDVGGSFGSRMAAIGVRGGAENIAAGQRNVPEVMASWSGSPGHAANMRNPAMRRMGVAKVGAYWTLILAQ
jgi:uncharacterized protein YkwD